MTKFRVMLSYTEVHTIVRLWEHQTCLSDIGWIAISPFKISTKKCISTKLHCYNKDASSIMTFSCCAGFSSSLITYTIDTSMIELVHDNYLCIIHHWHKIYAIDDNDGKVQSLMEYQSLPKMFHFHYQWSFLWTAPRDQHTPMLTFTGKKRF